jgi:hypothetical protein
MSCAVALLDLNGRKSRVGQSAGHREQAGVGEVAVVLKHVQDAAALPDGATLLDAQLVQRNETARGRALQ